jgi:hypothetical protein
MNPVNKILNRDVGRNRFQHKKLSKMSVNEKRQLYGSITYPDTTDSDVKKTPISEIDEYLIGQGFEK